MKKSTALLTTPSSVALAKEEQIPTINRLHTEATGLAEEARAKANTATQMAIIIGLKLAALKAATPHGQWEALFAGGMKRVKSNGNHGSHLIDFDRRTASKYIAVATEIVNRRLTPEQAQALQHIASAATLTPADSSFLEEVTPAETLRQLYLEMGIIKPTKKELHAMTHPLNEEPEEEEEEETPLTPAQRMAQKRDEARAYWFGTAKPDSIAPSFLLAIQQELNQPAQGRLHYLSKEDIHTMDDLVTQLQKRLKKLKTEIQ